MANSDSVAQVVVGIGSCANKREEGATGMYRANILVVEALIVG
jgi:hypothetical protein